MDTGALGVGWTRYDVRALYLMYDITSVVTAGSNVVGVMLGHGWKDDRSYPASDPSDHADHVTVLKFQVCPIPVLAPPSLVSSVLYP
jgi:hypothetical protein